MKTTASAPPPRKGGRWIRTQVSLDARAGRYTGQVGAAKNIASAVNLGDRRVRQIRDASHPGVPQKMLQWIDGLCDHPKTDPYPLLVMLLERVHERIAQSGTGRPWEVVCAEETRAQGELDLIQLCARGDRSPETLERFVAAAGDHVTRLLELMGAARAELAR